jgi:CTP:molybdopterin cytidylyltransferase MocA
MTSCPTWSWAPEVRIAGLLLAAGEGRRYGIPKALVDNDGQLLVETALATLRAGGCDPLIVVLGAAATEVRAQADLDAAVVVENPDYATGMGSSLRAGLAAASGADADAVAVLLVDTPGITAAAVRRLAGHGSSEALAMATYGGRPGHPVVIGRSHWDGVAASAIGDVGARPYLNRHRDQVVRVPCEDISDGADVDVPAVRE